MCDFLGPTYHFEFSCNEGLLKEALARSNQLLLDRDDHHLPYTTSNKRC